MELWIRTKQKKQLIECHQLSVGFNVVTRFFRSSRTEWWIIANETERLGCYKTKERCLEIIDEIQKRINAEPLGLLVCHDCKIPEETYDAVIRQFKENGLAAVYLTNGGDVQYIPKSVIVYEMPEE